MKTYQNIGSIHNDIQIIKKDLNEHNIKSLKQHIHLFNSNIHNNKKNINNTYPLIHTNNIHNDIHNDIQIIKKDLNEHNIKSLKQHIHQFNSNIHNKKNINDTSSPIHTNNIYKDIQIIQKDLNEQNIKSLKQHIYKFASNIHKNKKDNDITYEDIMDDTDMKTYNIIVTAFKKMFEAIVKSQSNELDNLLVNIYTNIGADIENYSDQYSIGHLEGLTVSFTYDVYTNLVQGLFEEQYEGSLGFTQLRTILASCLEVLYKAIQSSKYCKSEIARLNNIIESFRAARGVVMEAETTLETVAEIREEVKIYYERHGFPEGGILDAEKLAAILKELSNN